MSDYSILATSASPSLIAAILLESDSTSLDAFVSEASLLGQGTPSLSTLARVLSRSATDDTGKKHTKAQKILKDIAKFQSEIDSAPEDERAEMEQSKAKEIAATIKRDYAPHHQELPKKY